MIEEKDRLIEDKWYHVHLEDGYYSSRCDIIKVMGKYHFIGRLVVHLNNKLVFNLNNGEGSVIIPFENIRWMVPLYNSELKVEAKKTEYCNIKYKEKEEWIWE